VDSDSQERIKALLSLIYEIDFRMFEALLAAWEALDADEETVAVHMRVAYGQGYVDALTEGRRGSLYRDHGFTVPKRRRALKCSSPKRP
jgi:hypothetical protein